MAASDQKGPGDHDNRSGDPGKRTADDYGSARGPGDNFPVIPIQYTTSSPNLRLFNPIDSNFLGVFMKLSQK
jgi:hypothetical protein